MNTVPEPPLPPDDEVVGPMEAMHHLTAVFRNGNTVQARDRLMAAAAIINFHLAAEISALVQAIVAGPEGLERE